MMMTRLHDGEAASFSPRLVERRVLGIHDAGARPPNPQTLLSEQQLIEQQQKLIDWWRTKNSILCLTGAGISTESGIPDYRGSNGSYHKGHKPVVHDQFMTLEYQRKRYWGRAMVGWRSFRDTLPSAGHYALADLERFGRLGVAYSDPAADFVSNERQHDNIGPLASGQQQQHRLAVVTQNVDGLHRRAGSQHLMELHGRLDQVQCMQCGQVTCRNEFHTQLEELNKGWLEGATLFEHDDSMRPDGDVAVRTDDFGAVQVPSCQNCATGFLKPAVVFFGDTVPMQRVERFRAAIANADGLLVVGSSLAVHSAFRHVREACQLGIPVAILNVGETRAEREGLTVLKIEAPVGSTLAGVSAFFNNTPT
jgi:NAD+-dependent protein deacetylase sirtuin 4